MGDNWLKHIDFQNLSSQSLGEVDPEKRLENIENKVKDAFDFSKKLKEKSKQIPLEKFLPLLNNVNAISQHNYKYIHVKILEKSHFFFIKCFSEFNTSKQTFRREIV